MAGVDLSAWGVQRARTARPDLEFDDASAYDPLRKNLGTFSVVVYLEVIEHVLEPYRFARTVTDVLPSGGIALISTPYHGWLTNAAIAVLGSFDEHVDPLRVHGHVKSWSRHTLTRLLQEAGLGLPEIRRSGRILPQGKSMQAVARRNAESPEG